jgi:hypothetical protein
MFAKYIEEDGRFAFALEDNGGKEITTEYHAELIAGEQNGQRITPDTNGRPVLTDAPPLPDEILKDQARREGIKFEGVMCSATAQDMWGLKSVEDWIRGGASTNFKFDNGNVLELTPANIDAFYAVWVPFRASFF